MTKTTPPPVAAATGNEHRDLKYRRQYFPGAEDLVFKTSQKGFAPIPLVLRKVLHYLTLAEVRLLLYLHLRASQYGICYPTMDEIVYDLKLSSRKHLSQPLKGLVEKGFISTAEGQGRRFFLIHDPRVAIELAAQEKHLPESVIDDIDELYELLKQPTVARVKK